MKEKCYYINSDCLETPTHAACAGHIQYLKDWFKRNGNRAEVIERPDLAL